MAGPSGAYSKKTILVDFSILNQDAIKAIQEITAKIDNLKAWQKSLEAAGEKGSAVWIKNEAAIRDYTKALKANQKELDANIQAQKQEGDSLNAMRGTLKSLTAEYEDLTKAERESAQGEELLKKIEQQRVEVEKLEHQLGQYGRQVGNYESALSGLGTGAGKLSTLFRQLSKGTITVGTAFKAGVGVVKSFSKSLLSLLANPVVAIIAAISLAVLKLVQAFKKNEQAVAKLKEAFKEFEPVLAIVDKLIGGLAEVISKVVASVGKLTTAFAAILFPDWVGEAENAKKYAEAQQEALEGAQSEAEAIGNIWLREGRRDKDVEKIAKGYDELIKNQTINEQKAFRAWEELDIKRRKGQKYDEDELKRLNGVYQTEYDKRIQLEENKEAAIQQVNDEIAKSNSDLANSTADAVNKELAELRKLQDLEIDAMPDGFEKRKKQIEVLFNRQIEDLTRRLNTEKNLTVNAREAINKQIGILEEQKNKKIAEEAEKVNELIRQFEDETVRHIVNAGADAYEKQRIAISEKYDKIIADARVKYKELGKTDEEWAEFEASVFANRDAEISELTAQEFEDIRKLEEQINSIQLNPVKLTSEQELENLKTLKQTLEQLYNDAMAAVEENGTVEQYENLLKVKQQLLKVNEQISAQEDLIRQKEQKNVQQRIDDTTAVLSSMQQVVNGLGGVFSELAQTNEKFAKYSKALAITEAVIAGVIASVQAIATATRSSHTWVDMLVAVATVTATVASIVGTAIAQLRETKVQSAPKFWAGGPVEGPDGKDKVNAWLTKGEYVIRKDRVEQLGLPFLNQLNYGKNLHYPNLSGHYANGGAVTSGVSVDMDYSQMKDVMKEAFTESLEAMPSPIVDVREVTNVQNRVKIKQNIARQ